MDQRNLMEYFNKHFVAVYNSVQQANLVYDTNGNLVHTLVGYLSLAGTKIIVMDFVPIRPTIHVIETNQTRNLPACQRQKGVYFHDNQYLNTTKSTSVDNFIQRCRGKLYSIYYVQRTLLHCLQKCTWTFPQNHQFDTKPVLGRLQFWR
jgi:hypothetical protein